MKMPSFHPAESSYELFIQAVKGYEIAGSMKGQGGGVTLC
jgi:hypothetical protein